VLRQSAAQYFQQHVTVNFLPFSTVFVSSNFMPLLLTKRILHICILLFSLHTVLQLQNWNLWIVKLFSLTR